MLVLTRKPGQSFVIGDNITITINAVDGQAVKVGISAPREVKITRSELLANPQDAGKNQKEFER